MSTSAHSPTRTPPNALANVLLPVPLPHTQQQITAEQIVLEARQLQDAQFKPPEQKIQDEAELAEYRLRKRKGFEDNVRRMRWNQAAWAKVRRHDGGTGGGAGVRLRGGGGV